MPAMDAESLATSIEYTRVVSVSSLSVDPFPQHSLLAEWAVRQRFVVLLVE